MGRFYIKREEKPVPQLKYETLDGEEILLGLEGFDPDHGKDDNELEVEVAFNEASANLEHASLILQAIDKSNDSVLQMDVQIPEPEYKAGVVEPQWEESEETAKAKKEEEFTAKVVEKYGLDKKKDVKNLGEEVVSLSKEGYTVSQEGFMDSIKNFFKWLGETIKKWWDKLWNNEDSRASEAMKALNDAKDKVREMIQDVNRTWQEYIKDHVVHLDHGDKADSIARFIAGVSISRGTNGGFNVEHVEKKCNEISSDVNNLSAIMKAFKENYIEKTAKEIIGYTSEDLTRLSKETFKKFAKEANESISAIISKDGFSKNEVDGITHHVFVSPVVSNGYVFLDISEYKSDKTTFQWELNAPTSTSTNIDSIIEDIGGYPNIHKYMKEIGKNQTKFESFCKSLDTAIDEAIKLEQAYADMVKTYNVRLNKWAYTQFDVDVKNAEGDYEIVDIEEFKSIIAPIMKFGLYGINILRGMNDRTRLGLVGLVNALENKSFSKDKVDANYVG